jgi:hypothetical protein
MTVARAVPLMASVLLLLPSSAPAQEPGVKYDPNSPAGKQYALPLEEARRGSGAPGPGASPGAGQGQGEEAALFGAGVSKSSHSSSPGKSKSRGNSGKPAGGSNRAGRDEGRSENASSNPPRPGTVEQAVAEASGTQALAATLFALAACIVAVLAAGVGRRVRR